MTRTPEEVFAHHVQALGGGDLDGIVSDYTDDAVFITPAGIKQGKAGVREAFTQLLADVPNAAWSSRRRSTPATCCSWSGSRFRPRPRWRTGSKRSCSVTG